MGERSAQQEPQDEVSILLIATTVGWSRHDPGRKKWGWRSFPMVEGGVDLEYDPSINDPHVKPFGPISNSVLTSH